jgi:hypothetical protein
MDMNHNDEVWVTVPLNAARDEDYKVAVSLKDLSQRTNDFSIKNVGGCEASLRESNPKDMFMRYNVKCSLKNSDPAGHDVRVKLDPSTIDDKARYDNLDITCSCSCPAFLYWGAQWNLHQQDALEGQPRPLLKAPTKRLDLRSQFLICKHVKVVFDRIIPSLQRVINDIKRRKAVEEFKKQEEAERIQEEKDQTLQDEVARRKKFRPDKPKPGEGGVDTKRKPVQRNGVIQ